MLAGPQGYEARQKPTIVILLNLPELEEVLMHFFSPSMC
jgi:hypothetical protein